MGNKILALLLLIFFISSCALGVKVPGNRFQTSETSGKKGHFRVGAGEAGMSKVTLTPASDSVYINEKNPEISNAESSLIVDGRYAATRRLDLGILYYHDSTLSYLLKWQFLEGRFLQDKKYSMALSVSSGYSSDYANGVNSLRRTKSKIEYINSDLGLIAGIRPYSNFLIYGGIFDMFMTYEGQQTIDGDRRLYDGSIDSETITLGLEIAAEERWKIQIEGARSLIRTSASKKIQDSYDKAKIVHNIGAKLNFDFQ
ncbi:MAG: hypothetical protein A2X86_08280 [Bdellovibrionales bacterium GWA2_49_15]|nr:MAG: hypothetical protein A2X86_08280 [Bdellovibrionales bacterium GWA2_49_15]HAZ11242.1 hypothetical protein [Bdellovibrionales bacterium]